MTIRKWTERDAEHLRMLYAQGRSDSDIAYIMSRDRVLIRRKRLAANLGPALGKPGGCSPVRTAAHREKISEGLRRHWQTRPDREEAIRIKTAYLAGAKSSGSRGRRTRPPKGTPERRLFDKLADLMGAKRAHAEWRKQPPVHQGNPDAD